MIGEHRRRDATEDRSEHSDNERHDGERVGLVLVVVLGLGGRLLVTRGGRGRVVPFDVVTFCGIDQREDRGGVLGLLTAFRGLFDPGDLFAAAVGLDGRERQRVNVVGQRAD